MDNFFDELVKKHLDETIKWRRHLHQYPELSFKEYETTKYIISILENLENIEINKVSDTGVIGILKGKRPGKIVGLRADIDALKIQEENDFDFKSKNEGIMHACGHDTHTAILLATATILNDLVDMISGEVRFIFQPAEEVSPGGAIQLVNSGALDDVDYFFAQHIMPDYPTGSVAIKSGAMFAAGDSFDITFYGKGGHAAAPHLSVDPIMIAVEVIQAFQTIVSRKAHPLHSPTISTTIVNTKAGQAKNIIPDSINIKGSIRNYDEKVRVETEQWIKQIANGIASTHGGRTDIIYQMGYDPVINDEECFEISKKAAHSFLETKDILILKDPQQASEDFSEYNKIAPGNYIIIGTRNEDKQTNVNLHNSKYKIDEDSLYYGIMMHLNTIKEILM